MRNYARIMCEKIRLIEIVLYPIQQAYYGIVYLIRTMSCRCHLVRLAGKRR